ncbi:efflux RND transporter periplasmic adaptor subunit [Aureibaculum marinum]|uniref:Efflux RND transporter periplasmic adaptor subunit n=1 Tax=Aureibaculum marinum TaxID=2487930 RepID=A0A3N4NJD3_9FLAO|nr:efflux RND transporter periplasmic adaptor subunit [Aureibaculum marinum]RPD96512.1 efflux RND transporter periplasmic adaptor subunit [Aureibaculum marinum]
MKSKILLIILSVFTIISCTDKKQTNPQQTKIKPFPVIEIPTKTVTVYNSYPANIEGIINSEVRPKVSGYITQVLVDEGEEVKQGQTLFKLETQSLSQEANAAQANINAAQVEVDKLKPLVEKNIISSVQLETAKAKLAQAKSNYNTVTANIGYANIKSPVNGVVGTINYRKGALVSSLNQLPITRISSINKVYAYFSLNEKDFLTFLSNAEGKNMKEKIKNLPQVSLIMANGEEYNKKGTIETISGEINQQTGSISFRAVFDNSEGLLRNGSSGTIKLPKTFKDATIVPILSTFEQQGKTFVYKVVKDSLVPISIDIIASKEKIYVVKNGVSKGTTILAKGANKVKAGMKILPNLTPLDSILNSYEPVFK